MAKRPLLIQTARSTKDAASSPYKGVGANPGKQFSGGIASITAEGEIPKLGGRLVKGSIKILPVVS